MRTRAWFLLMALLPFPVFAQTTTVTSLPRPADDNLPLQVPPPPMGYIPPPGVPDGTPQTQCQRIAAFDRRSASQASNSTLATRSRVAPSKRAGRIARTCPTQNVLPLGTGPTTLPTGSAANAAGRSQANSVSSLPLGACSVVRRAEWRRGQRRRRRCEQRARRQRGDAPLGSESGRRSVHDERRAAKGSPGHRQGR